MFRVEIVHKRQHGMKHQDCAQGAHASDHGLTSQCRHGTSLADHRHSDGRQDYCQVVTVGNGKRLDTHTHTHTHTATNSKAEGKCAEREDKCGGRRTVPITAVTIQLAVLWRGATRRSRGATAKPAMAMKPYAAKKQLAGLIDIQHARVSTKPLWYGAHGDTA